MVQPARLVPLLAVVIFLVPALARARSAPDRQPPSADTPAAAAAPAPAPAAPPSDLADRLRKARPSEAKPGAPPAAPPASVEQEAREDGEAFDPVVWATYFPDRDRLLAPALAAERRLALRDASAEERLQADEAIRGYREARGEAVERMRSDAFGPAAVVVSGGTSLGAYEAGLLYYYTYIQARWSELEARRRALEGLDRPRKFQVATGTSAGAINAFLSALAACRAPEPRPEDSLFAVWTEVDWNELLQGIDQNQCGYLPGALKRTRIRELMARVEAILGGKERGGQTSRWVKCDVAFGLAVTNVVPRQVPLSRGGGWGHSNLLVSRLTERFVVRLEGEGGAPPRLTAVRGSEIGLQDEFLPVLGDPPAVSRQAPAALEPRHVTGLLLASSGIPGVFNPVRLEFSVDEGQGPRYHAGCFMDGGVLDNVPLSTAIRLAEHPPAGPAARRGPRPFYFYVDPDNVERPPAPPKEPDGKLLPAIGTLLGNLIKGARQAELVRTLEVEPKARLRLRLPARKHVITGELLSAFGAFLDSSFRRFDFLAGMADAQRALRGSVFHAEVRRAGLDRVELPAFACFERVWSSTDAMDSDPACLALRDSGAAMDRDLWRLLHASVALDQQRDDPNLTRRFFELLSSSTGARIGGKAATGYEYLTLGFGKVPGRSLADPDEGLPAARYQLQRAVSGVAAGSGSWLTEATINTAGAALLDDVLVYRKVRATWSTGLVGHGLELAASWQPGLSPLDLVAELQLADRRFAPFDNQGRMADLRGRAGLRWEYGGLPGFQLQGGATYGLQAIIANAARPLYRANWSLRGDVQYLQRFYVSLVWARGLGPASPVEPRSDLNVGFGLRWWLD